MRKVVIPKPFKSVRGSIKGWFTIIDLLFIFLISFPIMLIPLVAGMNVQSIKNMIWYGVLLITNVIFTFGMIYPWMSDGKKFYILVYEMVSYFLGVKEYKRNIDKVIPVLEICDDYITTTSGFTSVLMVSGINITLLSEEDQLQVTKLFASIFNNTDGNISIYKMKLPFHYSSRSDFLNDKINKLIKSHLTKNIHTLIEVDEQFIENLDKQELIDFFKSQLPLLKSAGTNDLLKLLQLIENVKESFHCIDSNNYENGFFITLTCSDINSLKLQTNYLFNACQRINFLPKKLVGDDLKKWNNSFYGDDYLYPKNNQNSVKPKTISFKPRYFKITQANEIFFQKNIALCDFPLETCSGWLNDLITNVDASIVIKTEIARNERLTDILDKKIKVAYDNNIIARENSQRQKSSKEIKSLELMGKYVSDGEKLVSFMVMVNIKANSSSEVIKKYHSIRKEIMARGGFKVSGLTFKQKIAYSSYLPKMNDQLFRAMSNTLLTNDFAEGFPIANEKMQDSDAVIIGSDTNGSPVMIDFKKRNEERINSSITVFGTSGSGKSTLSKKIIKDLIIDGTKLYLLDPEEEYTYLMNNVGGVVLNMGINSNIKLNPLEVFIEHPSEDDIVDHISFVTSFIKIAAHLTEDEQSILPEILSKVYEGIKLKIIQNRIVTSIDYPLIEDVYSCANEMAKTQTDIPNNWKIRVEGYQSLATKMSRLVFDPVKSKLWNNISNITDASSRSISFNIKELTSAHSKQIINAQIFLILKYVEKKIMENKLKYFTPVEQAENIEEKERLMKIWNTKWVGVVVDEAHLLIDKSNLEPLKFLYTIVKRIRKYNGLTLIITQNIGDFTLDKDTIKETSGIISNSQYQFIFNLKPKDVSDLDLLLKDQGGLTNTEKEYLKAAPRGACLVFVTTTKRFLMRVEMSSKELLTIQP